MMVKKDFEIVAREFGWDFHLFTVRYDFAAHKVVPNSLTNFRENDDIKCVGITAALFTLSKAFLASNPRFDIIKFYKAINAYADKADEIGNGIFL